MCLGHSDEERDWAVTVLTWWWVGSTGMEQDSLVPPYLYEFLSPHRPQVVQNSAAHLLIHTRCCEDTLPSFILSTGSTALCPPTYLSSSAHTDPPKSSESPPLSPSCYTIKGEELGGRSFTTPHTLFFPSVSVTHPLDLILYPVYKSNICPSLWPSPHVTDWKCYMYCLQVAGLFLFVLVCILKSPRWLEACWLRTVPLDWLTGQVVSFLK